ncbi:MAG: hypothetical protein EBV05_11590 [Cyanobacteria bacterium WB6_1B_304]|nr:hypothetical protein [Cyanobacteria bacterium WB6_1B_304]
MAFDGVYSHLRDAQVFTYLLILLSTATLIAIIFEAMVMHLRQKATIDWHEHRGFSATQFPSASILLYQQKLSPL